MSLLFCLFPLILSAREAKPDTLPESVAGLIAAFNAHDAEAMGKFVTDDIALLYIDKSTVIPDAKGRDALVSGMKSYFASIKDVHSVSESVMVAGNHVAVHERVTWSGKNGKKTQASLAVYELAGDGRISRVWYYPAHK